MTKLIKELLSNIRKRSMLHRLPEIPFASCALAVFAVLLVLSPVPARADLIVTEAVSISTTVTLVGGTADTSLFASFNPALGTLVSISASLAGTLNYTGGGPGGGNLELETDPEPDDGCISVYNSCLVFPAKGTGLPFSFTLSNITTPSVLSSYTGVGLNDFVVYDFAGDVGDAFAMTGDGTVTYDYKPLVPTPEPSSILLFGAVLVGVAVALKRERFRTALEELHFRSCKNSVQ
jgi:hypothetical protein